MKTFYSLNYQDTVNLGQKIARCLKPSTLVALIGELGSGKTTFTKGLSLGLGIKSADMVVSPSFVLLKEYKGKIPLYHFDLYRLNKIQDLEQLGYEEYFYGNGLNVVEWAEKAEELLPEDYLKVELSHRKINERLIKITSVGRKYKDLIKKFEDF